VSSRVLWELQSGLSVLRMEPGNPILHVMVIHERLKMAAILVLVLTELLATEHWEQAETGTLELTEADLRVLEEEVTTEIRDPGTMEEDRETTTVEDRGMEVMEVKEATMVEVRDLRTIEANKTTAATTGDLSRTTTTTTDPGQLQL